MQSLWIIFFFFARKDIPCGVKTECWTKSFLDSYDVHFFLQYVTFTYILGMSNTQTNYSGFSDVRAHITCCLKRFRAISVTVFALSVQPDISEWVV